MSHELVFAIPGDLETHTGGYAYDRRMIVELEALGWAVRVLPLAGTFPHPAPEDRGEMERLLGDLPDGTIVLMDGLAFSAAADIVSAEARRLCLAALIHHPLAREADLAPERADQLREDETRALTAARLVIVTSNGTARELRDHFGVPAEKITVVRPGTERAPRAPALGDPPVVLSIGSLVPRKGHDVLVEALYGLADLPWCCRIVGAADRDADCAADLADRIQRAGLRDRIAILGDVPDVEAELAGADIFALATRHEGYGMVFAEALAHGLPIVGTCAGAVPEVVPEGAGILVDPDDPSAFREALRRLLTDPAERARLADAAWAARLGLATWSHSAARIDAALQRIAP